MKKYQIGLGALAFGLASLTGCGQNKSNDVMRVEELTKESSYSVEGSIDNIEFSYHCSPSDAQLNLIMSHNKAAWIFDTNFDGNVDVIQIGYIAFKYRDDKVEIYDLNQDVNTPLENPDKRNALKLLRWANNALAYVQERIKEECPDVPASPSSKKDIGALVAEFEKFEF